MQPPQPAGGVPNRGLRHARASDSTSADGAAVPHRCGVNNRPVGTGRSNAARAKIVSQDLLEAHMALILWIIAVVLVISGIVSLFRGHMLWGAVLIIVGLLDRKSTRLNSSH